jgi:hypothetical protein
MRSVAFAEWILARLTDRTRAASTVGDLLETSHLRGMVWFWVSLGRIVVSLVWRRPIGWLAACCLGKLYLNLLRRPLQLLPGHGPYYSPLVLILMVAVCFLWVVTPYSLIRYGLRDRFTQLASVMSGLTTAAIFLYRVPHLTVLFSSIAGAILIVSLLSPLWRRPLFGLVITLLTGFGGAVLVGQLLDGMNRVLDAHGYRSGYIFFNLRPSGVDMGLHHCLFTDASPFTSI